MLGQFNTSYFGFRSRVAEEKTFHGTNSIATGIMFNNHKTYQIEKIVSESPTDISSKDLQNGYILIAVNGVEVDGNKNRESYFINPKSLDEMNLTFSRNKKEFSMNKHFTSYRNVKSLIYDEWQDNHQKQVDEKSNNEIAYIHMKNMTGGALTKFYHDLMSNDADKKSLILD